MDKNKNFFKTIALAFHPGKYDELSERRTKDAFKYFFSFMLVAFILLMLVSIPFLIMAPSYINKQLEKFDKLEFTVEVAMNDAVHVTDSSPRLLIDTRVDKYNFSKTPEERYIVTNKYFYVQKPFSKNYDSFAMGTYKDVLDNKGWYSNLLILMIVLMIPSLLVIGYLYMALKYLLVILLAAVLGVIITRLLKFDITFARLFKVGIYAITPAILLELIGFVFNFGQYRLHYALFVLFFILGAVKSGNLENIHEKKRKPRFGVRSKKRKRSKDYIELGSME